MVDAVEDLIRTELGRLAAPVADRTPEWSDVRARVPHVGRVPITALRIALAVAVAVAVVVPAVAFSAGVRSFLGFESPRPRLRTGASDCRRSSARRPRRTSLGVALDHRRRLPTSSPSTRRDRHRIRVACSEEACVPVNRKRKLFNWSLSRGSGRTPTVLSGRIDPRLHAARVVLRWHGGFVTSPRRTATSSQPSPS